MSIESHVRTIGILHIVHSAFLVLIGLFLLALMAGIGAVTEDETAFFVLGGIGTLLSVILLILALPGLIGAVGLLQRQPWGRILTLVVSFLKLIDFPLGTALGVYSIVILLREDGVEYFERRDRLAPASQAH